MPFINSKVTTTISKEQEAQLKKLLTDAAASILGKPESWLMLGFEPECNIYFRGDNNLPTAYVEVSIYGSENKAEFDKFTGKVCEAFENVMGISPDRVYVKFNAVSSWGWNGGLL